MELPRQLAFPRAERRAVFAVTALAVAQPVFGQLGRAPEFLAAAGFDPRDVWALALGLFLGLPGLLVLLAEASGRVHPAARIAAYRLWLFLGLGLLASLVLRRLAPDLATVPALAGAALAAAAVVYIHARRRRLREFGNILSLLVWAVPVLFFLQPGVRALHRPVPAADAPVPTREPPPVVLVVWDELPVATLLAESGEIDEEWFPSFGRLARQSIWYRDALTTGAMTAAALPGLLSGRIPDMENLPAALADPRTVFRLLGRSHQRAAYSSVRGVVPEGVEILGGAAPSRWAGRASDLGILYLHLVSPRALRERLPPVGAGWGGFEDQREEGARFRQAIASLGRAPGPRPRFVYLHSSLPHHPWSYLPSGARYAAGRHLVAPGLHGVSSIGRWTTEPWPVVEAYQRHVLQAMFADALLGELIDRLHAADLWDPALVVVTADHGASFEPGHPLRIPTPATVAEVGAVPLFVKLPGQTAARVDDRRASLVDVVPSIADACGLEVPWPHDGTSLLRPPAGAGRVRWLGHSEAPSMRVDGALVADVLRLARARRRAFARSGEGSARNPFQVGPFSWLVGQSTGRIPVRPPSGPWLLERHDGEENSRLVPARLEMSVRGAPEGLEEPVPFAVAVGDEIVATTMTLPGTAPDLSVLLPEDVARRGIEDLRIFRIAAGSGSVTLEEIPVSTTAYRIAGGAVVAADGRRWTITPGAFRGAVHPQAFPATQGRERTLAWAVDDRGRPPVRLVAFVAGRSVGSAGPGVPAEDFLDYLRFTVPEEQVFYLLVPEGEEEALRVIALGDDGRAGELPVVSGP